MTHPLMKLPAGYDAWRTRGPDYDDYECDECGGNHVEERGWYDCECCDGTGVRLTADSRPLPRIVPLACGVTRSGWLRWSTYFAWDNDADCPSCEGEGRLQCETCEWNYWETKR